MEITINLFGGLSTINPVFLAIFILTIVIIRTWPRITEARSKAREQTALRDYQTQVNGLNRHVLDYLERYFRYPKQSSHKTLEWILLCYEQSPIAPNGVASWIDDYEEDPHPDDQN